MTDIAADLDIIRAQAQQVEAIRSDVAAARSNAGSVNLAGGAFGVMCSFLVPPAMLFSQVALSAIDAADQLLGRTATELQGFATDVEESEAQIVAAITTLQKDLG